MSHRHNTHEAAEQQGLIAKMHRSVQRQNRGVVRKRGSGKRKPLLTQEAFVESHKENDKRLKAYVNRPRKNSVALSKTARLELMPEAAKLLCANNARARIRFAKVVNEELLDFFADHEGEFVWFTMARNQYVMSLKESRSFYPLKPQAWVRQELNGISFFAMVDAALYTNVKALPGYSRGTWDRAVSWHVHGFAWNVRPSVMKARRESINSRFEALLPGVSVCHFTTVDASTLMGKAWYMLKAPHSAYRVYPKKEEVIDPETGEISKRSIGTFRQRKGDLRPSDLVRMCNCMAGLQLDELAFAGGEGKELLKAVNERALAPFNTAMCKYKDLRRASYLMLGCRPDPNAPLL